MTDLVADPASSAETPSVMGQRLHTFLDAERVADDLRRYFAIGLPPGPPGAGVFWEAGSNTSRAAATGSRSRTGSRRRI